MYAYHIFVSSEIVYSYRNKKHTLHHKSVLNSGSRDMQRVSVPIYILGRTLFNIAPSIH
jgi:hypothetical protein